MKGKVEELSTQAEKAKHEQETQKTALNAAETNVSKLKLDVASLKGTVKETEKRHQAFLNLATTVEKAAAEEAAASLAEAAAKAENAAAELEAKTQELAKAEAEAQGVRTAMDSASTKAEAMEASKADLESKLAAVRTFTITAVFCCC